MEKHIWRVCRRRRNLTALNDVMNGRVFSVASVNLIVPNCFGINFHHRRNFSTSTQKTQIFRWSNAIHGATLTYTFGIGMLADVGTNNYVNELMRSRSLKDIISCRFTFRLPLTYCILQIGKMRTMPYLLGYSNYLDWPLFLKPIKYMTNLKEQIFSENQEAAWKDV